jgi:hypothetical protein
MTSVEIGDDGFFVDALAIAAFKRPKRHAVQRNYLAVAKAAVLYSFADVDEEIPRLNFLGLEPILSRHKG